MTVPSTIAHTVQQAQEWLAGFPVTRTAEDMKPAEQQQAFQRSQQGAEGH